MPTGADRDTLIVDNAAIELAIIIVSFVQSNDSADVPFV
jgi:hypothetical protein